MGTPREIELLRESAAELRRQGNLEAAAQIDRALRRLAQDNLPAAVRRILGQTAEDLAESARRDGETDQRHDSAS